MAKKVTYSIPLRRLWKMYNQWCKNRKNPDAMVFYYDAFALANTHPIHIAQSEILTLNFWQKDFNKELLHVWFEQKELRDFLRDELPIKNLGDIKQYLIQEGEEMKTMAPELGKNLIWKRHDIALHVPYETDGYVFSYAMMPDGTFSLVYCSDTMAGILHESQFAKISKLTDKKAINLVKDFTLAVNLIAYMRCFPECIKEGVPKVNNSHESRYKGSSIRLDFSERIYSPAKGTKRPHLRKGYFKYLSSPFYKNKRNQFIWVKESSVNTKSKTVEMSDDEKKVQDFKS